ncbi:MAG: phosphatidate cytidylyltransferase [bacterium]|nr:phosphatidate cytidylyltransferase [bacterium]
MTVDAALSSEIVQFYAVLVGSLIILGGLALLAVTAISSKDIRPIWQTYRGWLIMAPLAFGFLIAGRTAVIVGVCLLALFGFREFARATGLYRDWWMTLGVMLAIVGVAAVSLVSDPGTGAHGWYGFFMALPVYVVGLLLVIPVIRNRTRGQLQSTALAVLGFVYFGWMFAHLGFLANADHPYGYILYLVFAVEVNDIAAFIFGKLFGRHKLRSEVSPNKTVEGSLGALAVSLALPWLLSFSFPHLGTLQLVLTGLIVGIGGQLGDLTISFIKRDIGVKDMGAVIPGHGGILDRIDSLIFVAPLFFHMVRFFHGIA